MIRLFPYPCDQFDESQSYGAIFKKKGRGLPDAYDANGNEVYFSDMRPVKLKDKIDPTIRFK